MPPTNHIQRLLLPVYIISLALSAALLFSVQPMIGKLLLPRVGGSPYVWNVVMAFFQLALLGGYVVAHLLRRFSAMAHAGIYLACLLLALPFLPVHLPADWAPQSSSFMPAEIVRLLLGLIAIPFIALSLGAPTLQRMFAATSHGKASDPYFLYVASNVGSLSGLLAYPLLIEPSLTTSGQAYLWMAGFAGLIICVALGSFLLVTAHGTDAPAPTASGPVKPGQHLWKRRLIWAVLAFIPSSLTLGVTTYITSDITASPLLWVMTLALYLLSYIIAFASRGAVLRQAGYRLFAWSVAAAAASTVLIIPFPSIAVSIALLAFASISLVCHSELARLRPDASRLTEFYLILSIGGALGGSFNAFIAPVVFNNIYEYQGLLILLLLVGWQRPLGRFKTPLIALNLILTFLCAGLLWVSTQTGSYDGRMLENVLIVIIAANIFILLCRYKPLRFAMVILISAYALIMNTMGYHVETSRNFFGVLTVKDYYDDLGLPVYRLLRHGTTTHGLQMLNPAEERLTTTYYSEQGPIGQLWQAVNPQRVAIMGLGAGTMNCLSQPGQSVHFFEIDPHIVELARTEFSFLSLCPAPQITVGDGRLALSKDTGTYDLIIIDAFSSDAIPIHLITREALQTYLARLAPDGVIGFHISNRFFDLERILAATAADMGLPALYGELNADQITRPGIIHPTQVLALSRTHAVFNRLLASGSPLWRLPHLTPGIRIWTDDYSNILSAIK